MITNFDLETIPQQGTLDQYLEDASKNFKAPSTLSKKQALIDMERDGDPTTKYWTKDDTLREWENFFRATKAEEVAEEEWRKTGFDGGKGEIITIAWAVEDDPVQVLHRDVHIELDGSLKIGSEKEMLFEFFALLSKARGNRNPYFVGHNIGFFDLKFLYRRCVLNQIRPYFDIPVTGRHGQHFHDTMIAWCGHKESIKQDELCKILGIEGKPGDIDGSKVWDHVKDGKVERVAEYNIDDVVKNREIYKRQMFSETVATQRHEPFSDDGFQKSVNTFQKFLNE